MANESTTNTKAAAPAAVAAAAAATAPEVREPIIIDLGKKNRRQVRKLRRGKPSRLMDRVEDVIAEAMEAHAIPEGTQPVIVVVREKKKRSKVGKIWGLG